MTRDQAIVNLEKSLLRYEQMPEDEVDAEEYEKLLRRVGQLRKARSTKKTSVEHATTADGVTVAVGTVLYNHEGVSRESWRKLDGKWWVEHHWQHFTHRNPASELYSSPEAAKMDWRNVMWGRAIAGAEEGK